MLTKNQIKFINSLATAKGRAENKFFIAEGFKLVSEILYSTFCIKTLFFSSDFPVNQLHFPISHNIEIVSISNSEMERISQQVTPAGVLAIVKIPDAIPLPVDCKQELIIALDNIHDPGNLGTIIRTADWFDVTHIVCSDHCVDAYNPKVIQSTMGSITRVKVHYTNLESWLANIPSPSNIYGSFLDGENLYKTPLPTNAIIIIGNESKGISNNLLPFIHKKIKIPSCKGRNFFEKAESLNASVATAIILNEFRRRE